MKIFEISKNVKQILSYIYRPVSVPAFPAILPSHGRKSKGS